MRPHTLALPTAIVLVLALGGPASGQAPPPAGPAHPNLTGTWVLDRTISDDPAHATFEPPAAQNRGREGGRGRGFGFGPGGFRGSFGGSRGDNREANVLTADERARLQALTDQVRVSSERLVISHNDPSFAVTDAQGHTALFQTTGSADQHQVATSTVPSTSSWSGSRLVVQYDLGGAHRLVYTYTLLERTEQLVLRIHLASGDDRRPSGPEAKFVYSLVPPARRPAAAAPVGASGR